MHHHISTKGRHLHWNKHLLYLPCLDHNFCQLQIHLHLHHKWIWSNQIFKGTHLYLDKHLLHLPCLDHKFCWLQTHLHLHNQWIWSNKIFKNRQKTMFTKVTNTPWNSSMHHLISTKGSHLHLDRHLLHLPCLVHNFCRLQTHLHLHHQWIWSNKIFKNR